MIPPHERPFIPVLRQLGFSGSDEQVLEKVARQAPHWLSSVSSASPMWVANAATIAPSADTLDGKVHLTVANLNNKFHRSLEAPVTESLLKAIFNDEEKFSVHSALPQVALLGDEGAANHNRLGGHYGEPGMQLFVYGREEGMIPAFPLSGATDSRSQRGGGKAESGESPTGDFRPAKPGRYRPGRFS